MTTSLDPPHLLSYTTFFTGAPPPFCPAADALRALLFKLAFTGAFCCVGPPTTLPARLGMGVERIGMRFPTFETTLCALDAAGVVLAVLAMLLPLADTGLGA